MASTPPIFAAERASTRGDSVDASDRTCPLKRRDRSTADRTNGQLSGSLRAKTRGRRIGPRLAIGLIRNGSGRLQRPSQEYNLIFLFAGVIMATRKIVITEADHNRLSTLLTSEFAKVISPVEYLEDLAAELQQASIVRPEDVPRNVVTMNSTVTLRDLETREKETYTLVYPEKADIANDRLSVLAPVGTAILGQRVGDELKWRVPAGWRRFKVERVDYQPEREGVFDVAPALERAGGVYFRETTQLA
jgi:regulator of nucleoside diphosphate kinase